MNDSRWQAQPTFDELFRHAPAGLDVDAIRMEWLALRPPYTVRERRMPAPIWARRGFADDGLSAWDAVSQVIAGGDPTKPYCVYVHIPFCASRCTFCDCYSYQIRQHRRRHLDRYVDLLRRETDVWGRIAPLSRRPVSTIHFGGGTPTILDPAQMARLVETLTDNLAVGTETEWALETTSSDFDDETRAHLEALGFRRLHVGVQSLENPVRRLLNRREPADAVLDKLAQAASRGWVVSVDIVCGLPGQTLGGALHDVRTLAAAGVQGFSVYELQLSPRNRRFARENALEGRDPLRDYFLFQAVTRTIESLGFRKTAFNHFALPADTNLYFTYPQRGEDCLALGTTGDGVFGDYHFRHPEYIPYCRDISDSFPGLQGGLRRTARESHLFPLEVALMSGTIRPALLKELLGYGRAGGLVERWGASGLLRPGESPDVWELTANGSWLAGNMMADIAG